MKWIQRKLKQWRSQAVLATFNRYFAKLIYDFEKIEDKLGKLNEVQKREYYRDVSAWISSEAYKLEYQGELEALYEELACKSQTEDVMTAYRLVLLKLKSRDLRLKQKSNEFLALQALHTTQSKL